MSNAAASLLAAPLLLLLALAAALAAKIIHIILRGRGLCPGLGVGGRDGPRGDICRRPSAAEAAAARGVGVRRPRGALHRRRRAGPPHDRAGRGECNSVIPPLR